MSKKIAVFLFLVAFSIGTIVEVFDVEPKSLDITTEDQTAVWSFFIPSPKKEIQSVSITVAFESPVGIKPENPILVDCVPNEFGRWECAQIVKVNSMHPGVMELHYVNVVFVNGKTDTIPFKEIEVYKAKTLMIAKSGVQRPSKRAVGYVNSVTCSPSVVNTTSASVSATATVNVNSNLVTFVYAVSIYAPNQNYYVYGSNAGGSYPNFLASMTFPRWIPGGMYQINYVYLYGPSLGYFIYYNSDFISAGMSADFVNVISQYDVVPPVLVSADFPVVVDTTALTATQYTSTWGRFNITETVSGLAGGYMSFGDSIDSFSFYFTGPQALSQPSMYNITVSNIPCCTRTGEFLINYSYMYDNAGNYGYFYSTSNIRYINNLTINSAPDIDPPVLTYFKFRNGNTVNTTGISSSSNLAVFMDFMANDRGGVYNFNNLFPWNIKFISPNNVTYEYSMYLTLYNGSNLNGFFYYAFYVTKWVDSGVWKITEMTIYDFRGNKLFMNPASLLSKGFPTQITLVSTTDITPPRAVSTFFGPNPFDFGGQTYTTTNLSVVLQDFPSGISYVYFIFLYQGASWNYYQASLFSGNSTYGLYSYTGTIGDDGSGFMMWRGIQASDVAGNQNFAYQMQYSRVAGYNLNCDLDSMEPDSTGYPIQVNFPVIAMNRSVCGYYDIDRMNFILPNNSVDGKDYRNITVFIHVGDSTIAAASVYDLSTGNKVTDIFALNQTHLVSVTQLRSGASYALQVQAQGKNYYNYTLHVKECGIRPISCGYTATYDLTNCRCAVPAPVTTDTSISGTTNNGDNVKKTSSTGNNTLLYGLIGGLGFLVIVVIVVVILLILMRRARSREQRELEARKEQYTDFSNNPHASADNLLVKNADSFYSSIRPQNVVPFTPPDPLKANKGSIKLTSDDPLENAKLTVPYSELVFKREIGSGSFGKVYFGEWQRTPVAIKVCSSMSPDSLKDFLGEARIMLNLRPHPNVVTMLGLSTDGPYPAMILEFCTNGSLDSWVYSKMPMSDPIKFKMLKGIALGMLHLHRNNIVHRDLATRNILLSEGNVPKISDFGLSRFLASTAQRTQSDTLPVRWMAPESLRDLTYSTKTDVWSYAVLATELINREIPHKDLDMLTVAFKVRDQGNPPSINFAIPPWMDQLLKACWNYDPDRRPNFDQIVESLDLNAV